MTALVSENTIASWPVSIQMCVHGESTVYCTTDLCLSVDKLEEGKKQQHGRNDVSVQRSMSILCTVCQLLKLRILTPPARLEALFKSSQSSPFVRSRIRSPSFLASDCVLGPSRCFVKRSAVLFFVSTRPTDRRFSRIHCCIAKHRISICLSPPGPLRCRMCRAESESISRRTETL